MGYRASASKGAKPTGQSAAAKHAYHLRADGYAVGLDGPREDLAASGYGNLPEFAADDPAAFWLASDSFERANGTLFRELQLNLPGELSLAQQQEVLQSYCARLFDGERLPHSWAIHRHTKDGEPVSGENDHAHLMVSETMTDDFPRPAEQHFKRYNSAKPDVGGAKKTRSLKPKAWLMEARAAWAEEVNRGLVAAGHEPRFDHRSKEVQLAEALRLGDLRRAARLDTPTQAHEGPRIAGMRRRVEAGKVALDDLPGYAQEVIKSNDQARELARAWLAQVDQMTDAELAGHFAAELDELNPGCHVAAWMNEQQRLAQDENQRRDVAAALEAGALELCTAAQIKAEPRQRVEQVRARIEQLRARVDTPEPAVIGEVLAAKRRVEQLERDAQAWRSAHPIRARLAGRETAAERTAREARDAYRAAPALDKARAAQAERRQSRAELDALSRQLPELERAAGIEPQADQDERSKAMLHFAASDLRRAEGWLQNHATRCSYELREPLHELRRQVMQELRQIEQLTKSPPPPEEAAQLRQQAAVRHAEARDWREVQESARAAKDAQKLRDKTPGLRLSAQAPTLKGPGMG